MWALVKPRSRCARPLLRHVGPTGCGDRTTTLLARQHAQSFQERFRGFPIRVRQLSRFVSSKEAALTRQGLADGTIDIVVGTHAVLAKTVKIANLGLLIIDEEQRFGVQHKERLKQLRSDIHVLTLSATPIPRTLQLSLTGVRDLSIIGTPPVDRLAIRTFVSEFDPFRSARHCCANIIGVGNPFTWCRGSRICPRWKSS